METLLNRAFAYKCGRSLKEERKKREFVLMKCPSCGEKYEIPAENYAKIRKNEWCAHNGYGERVVRKD